MPTYGGSSSSNPTRMVTFITSDHKEVQVPVAIATEFGIVSRYYDGDLNSPEVENAPFPLPNVDSLTLLDTVLIAELLNHCRSKYEALEKERLVELPSKYQALEEERQGSVVEFFDRRSDEMIVKLIRAADFLEYEELLDTVMPLFRRRFGLGDDKGVDFVYTAEADAILHRSAASASGGAGS